MELVQSFLLSITRVKLSVYEQRIITRIVEHGQKALQGYSLAQLKHLTNPFGNEKISVKIRYILTDGTKDYSKVVTACKALMSRQFEFYDPNTKTYYTDTVIHNVLHKERSGKVEFMVSRIFFEVMFNFSLGYKNYDLETALSLPTPSAVRMYVLLNNQVHPLTWSVERLKEMFGVSDKYTQTADFIKKVIEPSRKALLAASVNNFTYTRIYDGQKIIKLQFFPVKIDEKARRLFPDMSKEQITQSVAIRMYLHDNLGFTQKEMGANKSTIDAFAQVPDAITHLYTIAKRAVKKSSNMKGYIISAMKSEVKEWNEAIKELSKG